MHPSPEPADPTRLLFLDDVSALLQVPVATLRWWRSNKTGPPSFRLGRRVAYRPADVEAWVEAQFAADSTRAS